MRELRPEEPTKTGTAGGRVFAVSRTVASAYAGPIPTASNGCLVGRATDLLDATELLCLAVLSSGGNVKAA